jgi:3-methyladenine DNA glycosylase AlkD
MSALDIAAEHARLVAALAAAGTPYFGDPQGNDSYSGSRHPFYFVSVPERRAMARWWLRTSKPTAEQVLAMADSLFRGRSHEEKTLGALLLGYSAAARRVATPAMVDAWLGELHGWAEIDSLCASVFSAADLTVGWPAWRGLIERLASDPNINKRRAALVLLATPTRTTDDPRFAELAFQVIGALAPERDILITKAVSWLLRSMTARHAAAVAAYLDAHGSVLPAIAIRETRAKLASGTKSGRPSKMRKGRRYRQCFT